MLEQDLEQAKAQMLASDPDLAAKVVGKLEVRLERVTERDGNK